MAEHETNFRDLLQQIETVLYDAADVEPAAFLEALQRAKPTFLNLLRYKVGLSMNVYTGAGLLAVPRYQRRRVVMITSASAACWCLHFVFSFFGQRCSGMRAAPQGSRAGSGSGSVQCRHRHCQRSSPNTLLALPRRLPAQWIFVS